MDSSFSNLDYTTNNNGTLIYRKGYGEQEKESWGVINYIRKIQVKDKVVPDQVTLINVEAALKVIEENQVNVSQNTMQ